MTRIFARAPSRNVQSIVALFRTWVISSAAITLRCLSPIACTADSLVASASLLGIGSDKLNAFKIPTSASSVPISSSAFLSSTSPRLRYLLELLVDPRQFARVQAELGDPALEVDRRRGFLGHRALDVVDADIFAKQRAYLRSKSFVRRLFLQLFQRLPVRCLPPIATVDARPQQHRSGSRRRRELVILRKLEESVDTFC
jgi:hypothetical protein